MTRQNLLLVSTTWPSGAEQEPPQAFIQQALDSRLAACIQCLPAMQSFYRWEGEIQNDAEQLLLVKTTADNYAALERLIERLHPYNVPEIIATPITQALPTYNQWVVNETRPKPTIC